MSVIGGLPRFLEGLTRASWPHSRVLSVQFLALCRLKPSLVVELARELLDFVGSVSSVSSKASLFTCVVRAPCPLPGAA